MSQYCDDAELRVALPLDQATKVADFGDLITDVSDGFDQYLGFSYGGPARIVTLTGDGEAKLFLPRPGAKVNGITSIVEDGVTLDPSLYELEPGFCRYVLRLDADGEPDAWSTDPRSIVVTYAPKECPPSLRRRCIVECVRIYRSRQSGHSRTIGAPGISRLDYPDGFDKATMTLLNALKWNAGNGGSGWVTS